MLCALMVACGGPASPPIAGEAEPAPAKVEEPRGAENLAYRWGTILLEAIANDTERISPRPPISSRMLALVTAAQYDAWSYFHDRAKPLLDVGISRRPADQRTRENAEIAISYANLRTICHYFPDDHGIVEAFMRSLGHDPKPERYDPESPMGIGIRVAQAWIETRKSDGSNEVGDHPDGPAGVA